MNDIKKLLELVDFISNLTDKDNSQLNKLADMFEQFPNPAETAFAIGLILSNRENSNAICQDMK